MSDVITFMKDEYENSKTGEKVPGITVIIDGKLRQALDIVLERSTEYKSYLDIMQQAFSVGLETVVNEVMKRK